MLMREIGQAIEERSVGDVIRFMKSEFSEVLETPPGYVHLLKATEECHINMKSLLELVFGCHLSNVFRLASKGGFASLLVAPFEIMTVLETPPDDVSDDLKFLI